MITCKVGRPGTGKSATASKEIRYWVSKGIHVYTNLHVNEDSPYYHFFETKDWQIIFTLQDGIIVFDEGQFILDARQWAETPVEFRQLLQKGRHEGLDFYILTQNIMQIDVAARRLIHEAKQVVKLFSRRNLGLYLEWPIDISGLDKQTIGSIFPCAGYVLIKEDWEYYDSHALRSRKDPPLSTCCTQCGVVHQLIPLKEENTGRRG